MQRTFYNEIELLEFAAAFGRFLQVGDVVALAGALGSGKTTFVRGIVQGRLQHDPVSSPTFTFAHRYEADPPIDHLDLYRIEDSGELAELGFYELLDGTSIVLIEWWQNAPSLVPRQRYEITLEGAGSSPRSLRLETINARALPQYLLA
ncbi:MAG: tRNA (adenosine(37)-N6)-threonylcarbamoyltransferase complex ATPase subunit type 1 TsaE [Candidatus Eremiobacteraeota bacterium]|nr:tRNA (adenosine(37)-N6)-threonylcarbamoyltransferase complex ATPase subunit type 1 TsaE [Candidatus Eremiobacteraeota bacterium]